LDRPGFIAIEIFPYDIAKGRLIIHQVEEMLSELENAREPFIFRYEVEGRKIIQILNFLKHNSPHATEKPSEIPPYQEVKSRKQKAKLTVNSPKSNGGVTVNSPKSNGEYRPDSLNPESLNPELTLDTSPKGKVVDGPAAPSADLSPSGSVSQTEEVLVEGGNSKGASRLSPNDLARLWNETADPVFPRVIVPLSEKRVRKFRPAVRAQPDPEWWKSLFGKAGGISFLRGENNRGWRANLEFMVNRWEDILEGKYDNTKTLKEPNQKADPDCQICAGDGWEYVEENGDHWAKPCQCLTKRGRYAGNSHKP